MDMIQKNTKPCIRNYSLIIEQIVINKEYGHYSKKK